MNTSQANVSFRIIKDKLANSALFGLFILIVPAVLSSVYRSIFEGWQVVYYWHITAGFIIILSWLFRKQLSFRLRSAILIALFYVTGLSGYYSYGLFSFASVYFIMVILFSVILLGYRAAYVSMLVCFVSLLGIYGAIHNGWVVYKVDFNIHHSLFSSWLTAMVTFLMFSVVITLLVGKLHVNLYETIEKIEKSEEKFRLMIKNSNDSFVLINENGEQFYISDAASRDTGFTTEELNGPIKNVIYPDDWHIIEDAWKKVVLNKGETVRVQYRHKHKFKDYIWYEAVAQNFLDNPAINAVVVNVRDITAIKETEAELIKAKEKAEESDRLKSAFLANMSHEIRTPMNAIIGFSDFLLNPNMPEYKKERFSKIIQQRSYDLLQIIEDTLDISKIEVGQMKLSESEFELKEFMYDLFNFYNQKIKNSATKSGISIKLSLPDDIKTMFMVTDKQRLRQVFINLLDNAIKFTDFGEIEFGCTRQEDTTLLFFVYDTGIGIAPEKHEIIFDRFRQADEALTAKKYGGTGLGLSIVKGIVNQLNGKIWLQSNLDEGTKFYFTFPITLKESFHELFGENSETERPLWKNKTLLIVEDDVANAEYLKELFSGSGIRVFNAFNGKETLSIVEKNPTIDLILMDIRLPDTNGLLLTKAIRKKYPKIKIVAQTAYASPSDLQDCLDAGCHNYIAKPLGQRSLFSIVGQLLDKNS